MKKSLVFSLFLCAAFLLVAILYSPVVKAEYQRPFCPIDCSVYVSDSGSVLLAPLPDNGQTMPGKVFLREKVYVLAQIDTETSRAIVKKNCSKECTIYKVDGSQAVASYRATVQ